MSRIPIKANSVDPATGNAVAGVSVTIKNSLTATNVTVYAAQSGGSTVSNPVTTDSNGRYFCWVDRGPIQLDYAGAGITAFSEWAGDLADPTDIVTALPGSPSDGQTILFQSAAMATNGQVWQLRYRAGGGTYKWEFVGGTPLTYNDTTVQTGLAASSGVATSLSPACTITLPLTGDYLLNYGARCGHTGTNQGCAVLPIATGLTFSGAGAQANVGQAGTTNSSNASIARSFIATGISGTLELKYTAGAANGEVGYRWITATPVRLG